MKQLLLISLLTLVILVFKASAFRQFAEKLVSKRLLFPKDSIPNFIERKSQNHQTPVVADSIPIHSPPSWSAMAQSKQEDDKSDLIVSDILGKTREINIFASLTREVEAISSRLNDASKNVTVLAPTNPAIQQLPRKPWEDPNDYEAFGEDDAYAGKEGDDRAARNLRRFVEAHIIPESPWSESKEVKTLEGTSVYWEKADDGKLYVSTAYLFGLAVGSIFSGKLTLFFVSRFNPVTSKFTE